LLLGGASPRFGCPERLPHLSDLFSPDESRPDLNGDDLEDLLREARADRAREKRTFWLRLPRGALNRFGPGDFVWLVDYGAAGRFEVLVAERSFLGDRYLLTRVGGPRQPGDEKFTI
jgi:hypothetical protein